MRAVPTPVLMLIWLVLGACWCAGILGRGFWTPDEPREADIAWRMSWQTSKAVPLLAGEAFCEKPPLTYWLAGAAIERFGMRAWVARLPNLAYALVTMLAVGWLGRRSAGPLAGLAAAAAISTFLLSYQVGIWLATDAPLLAADAAALVGLYVGFYAADGRQRLRGYTGMHVALAFGFLSKSAAAWMVPVLTLATLIVWERRWRELWRWELYVGLVAQAFIVIPWVAAVYGGPEGPEHLKVFFWNNLVGRFAAVDAPQALQYAAAHRNSPGKYLIELPVYLWPWTLLVAVAARSAWRRRGWEPERLRPVRFAVASFVPALAVLSVAATARNIYLAPALPGIALLLGWWVAETERGADVWERRAVRATSALLMTAALVLAVAAGLVGYEAGGALDARALYVLVTAFGVAAAAALSVRAWRSAACDPLPKALLALCVGYGMLLIAPAPQIYRRVDAWQNLSAIGSAIRRDATDRPLILFAPDETTRAFVDVYTRDRVIWVAPPITADATRALREAIAASPDSLVLAQLPARRRSLRWHDPDPDETLADTVAVAPWAGELRLGIVRRYELPNGRRYALLAAISR